MSVVTVAVAATAFALTRHLSALAHEAAHAAVALALGKAPTLVSARAVHVPGASACTPRDAALIRHAGWLASLALALAAALYAAPTTALHYATLAALWLTAADAVTSDLLGVSGLELGPDVFECGNFGLLLLNGSSKKIVTRMLRKMVKVTMNRGAQSAGIVTYIQEGKSRSARAVRSRVVNGKRSDLSELVMAKFARDVGGVVAGDLRATAGFRAPQLFQGHTRFATSSVADFKGCHPHRFTPPARQTHWAYDAAAASYVSHSVNVEHYVTHNGDLEFFKLHGEMVPTSKLFGILHWILDHPPPATVDSMGVAGLLDLMRCKGLWIASVRYGYLFGAFAPGRSVSAGQFERFAPSWELNHLALAFERCWMELLLSESKERAAAPTSDVEAANGGPPSASTFAAEMALAARLRPELERRLLKTVDVVCKGEAARRLRIPPATIPLFVHECVSAFFHNDLVVAASRILNHGVGSFGLVLSSSLDEDREMVLAARGQTMSFACYPTLGVVTFGSEIDATKVGLRLTPSEPSEDDRAFRFDLDDLHGEIVLLHWGGWRGKTSRRDATRRSLPMTVDTLEPVLAIKDGKRELCVFNHVLGGGRPNPLQSVKAAVEIHEPRSASASGSARRTFWSRVLWLNGNVNVTPLPHSVGDPVAHDLQDIPAALRRIQQDFDDEEVTPNKLAAWTFMGVLAPKMLTTEKSHRPCDDAYDLVITGCEVSLWLGEQFASDLHLALPHMKILCISANKLLAQIGQRFPIPQTGHSFSDEDMHNLENSVVLIISHSGGTFAPLMVSNLLRAFTKNIFCVTSGADTQLAKSVEPDLMQKGFAGIGWNCFDTHAGYRPAEPCTISVAATQQMLTNILLYTLYHIVHFHKEEIVKELRMTVCQKSLRELNMLNKEGLDSMDAILEGRYAERLRSQGRRWAQHVLEAPYSWMLSFVYIMATVTLGVTPLSASADAIAASVGGARGTPPAWTWWQLVVGGLDGIIYAFLPWWTTVLLRLCERRPWLHRVAGRALVIGDIPWVAQALEAYVSKLFALTYSITALAVHSGNAGDHLVHRFTHRVVRGSLLAVGRPDGRLNALSAAEGAVCLSVNQASSIQNYGARCESITVGHSRYALPLAANALYLPDRTLRFYCEVATEKLLSTTADSIESTEPPSVRSVRRSSVFFGDSGKSRPSSRHGSTNSLLDSADNSASIMSHFSAVAASKTDLTQEDGTPASRSKPIQFQRIEPINEPFIGGWMSGMNPAQRMEAQRVLQTLYEGRIASLHRFVAFAVLFHAMGKAVADFWSNVSFGWLAYDMSRSQSIMRVATTASPVSGGEVRDIMLEISERRSSAKAANRISQAYKKWRQFHMRHKFARRLRMKKGGFGLPFL